MGIVTVSSACSVLVEIKKLDPLVYYFIILRYITILPSASDTVGSSSLIHQRYVLPKSEKKTSTSERQFCDTRPFLGGYWRLLHRHHHLVLYFQVNPHCLKASSEHNKDSNYNT